VVTVSEWNALDYLGDEEAMAGYLQDALEEEGLDGFLDATADVMRARAILLLSRETGIA
jgi:DNA-binding phage protein